VTGLLIQLDCLVDDAAEFVENLALVTAMASTVNQSGRAADVGLVLLRPFDDLHVKITYLHAYPDTTTNVILAQAGTHASFTFRNLTARVRSVEAGTCRSTHSIRCIPKLFHDRSGAGEVMAIERLY